MYTKIYNELTLEVQNEWKLLWKSSEFANFTNSPDWFIAADNTYNYKEKKILTLFDNLDNLVGIGAFVKEKISGITIWTTPAREFAGNKSILIDFSRADLINIFLKELLVLGNVLLVNNEEFSLKLIEKSNTITTFHQDINHLVEFSYGRYGNLQQKRLNAINNRINSDNITMDIMVDMQDKENAFEEAIKIENDSSKLRNGKGVLNIPQAQDFYKNLIKQCPENIVISILTLNKKPAAYSIDFTYKNTTEGSQKAHLYEFNRYAPGRATIASVCDYTRQKNQLYYDFGRGDDEFKRSFSTRINDFYSIILSKNPMIRPYLKMFLTSRESAYKQLVKIKPLYRLYHSIKKGVHKTLNSEISLKRDMYLLIVEPRNFLYMTFMEKRNEKIKLSPYEENAEIIANNIVREIQGVTPLQVEFVGSNSLKLFGNNDIDLLAEFPKQKFKQILPSLIDLFGEPRKITDDFIDFTFSKENYHIDFSIVDPNHVLYKERVAAYNALRNNDNALREYEKLKRNSDGVTHLEYAKRKLLFFHKITKKYSAQDLNKMKGL